ncbi:Uu.00g109600.m01.CDS01 [Anthostomella pinea]|uniref:Uu.00g109600.m01.CDS01 n=1 Tax=Anthostomella pinea TaxID=933095 RepID=A0AAI8VET6_9PEZI|nr:Uu.00g109600.m01.CDS01 [Anthostomella pinea]
MAGNSTVPVGLFVSPNYQWKPPTENEYIQFLMQIIINRLSLVSDGPSAETWLRWSVVAYIGLINISVFIIWIPSQLHVSDRWMHINSIWDKIEKVLILVIDASLNCYFIYIVRTRMIAKGLTKYKTIYKFNLTMIFFSISLDFIIIGLMVLPNHIMFMLFQNAAYMVKLQIEMTIADLVGKIRRSGSKRSAGRWPPSRRVDNRRESWTSAHGARKFIATISRGANHTENLTQHSAHAEHVRPMDLARCASNLDALFPPPTGIKRTIRTDVSVSRRGDEGSFTSSSLTSTEHLPDQAELGTGDWDTAFDNMTKLSTREHTHTT